MAVDGFGYGGSAFARATWQELVESMGHVQDGLSGSSTAGLPADVASAGTVFLRRWVELAAHSRDTAERIVASLGQVDLRYRSVDAGVQTRFDHISARMSG